MTSEPTRTITVKLRKGGWEVEITCTEAQLKNAIESVLNTLEAPNTKTAEQIVASSNKTCRGLIIELWQERWFSQERALSDVHEELARRGYHYDKTAVSHSLTDLVRENMLTRQGNMRNYTYIQKRPSQSTSVSEEETNSEEINSST
jgi:hypothetical protein